MHHAWSITTNKHPNRWGDALHDDDLAEAIVDRILERGRLLRLDGPSVRTKHLPGGQLADDDQDDSTGRRFSGTNAAEVPEPTAPTRPSLLRPVRAPSHLSELALTRPSLLRPVRAPSHPYHVA